MSEAESPEEWAAEVRAIEAGRGSIDFLMDIELAVSALHRKEWLASKLEQRKRAAEDAEQEANRESIREENEAEAAAVLSQTCQSCFCIHAGGC